MNKTYTTFLKERTLIGEGAQSKVYKWNNYAYKCFNDNYPKDWIDYEIQIHKEINKTNLNVPRIYKCNFPMTIKMDLIDGKTSAEMFDMYGKDKVLNDFIDYFEIIHTIKGLDLLDNEKYLKKLINKSSVSDIQKTNALSYLKDINKQIKEKKVLCHNDYHFLNTMYQNDSIYVIDCIDARNGKPILDYARTYVITYQYAARLKQKYYKEIIKRKKYNTTLFNKAIYVEAIVRLQENNSKRIRNLIDALDKDIDSL